MHSLPSCPQVTAALIPMRDRLFIAQRSPLKRFGLYWEFPGGKVEKGESLEESLVREIREELCWNIRVGKLFRHVSCRRRDLQIDLFAFWCTVEGGDLSLKEHAAFRWVPVSELRQYLFTDADAQLLPFLEVAMTHPDGSPATQPQDVPAR